MYKLYIQVYKIQLSKCVSVTAKIYTLVLLFSCTYQTMIFTLMAFITTLISSIVF